MSFEIPKNFDPVITPKEEVAERFRHLTDKEKEELGLTKKRNRENESKEPASPVLRASWKNPETKIEQTIEIDLEKILKERKQFYKDNLNMEINESAVREIWSKNRAEIKSEIEKYGYDSIQIIPDNLPEEEVLNRDLIETMDEGPGKGKVAATWQSGNFESGGSFAGVKNSYAPKYRLVLTHSDQNIYENPNANPYLKATLGKNIMQLSGLNEEEVENRIKNNQEIEVNFETEINGQKIQIQAEGHSLEEYQLLQRMHFEKNHKHLDESGWTWLMKSFSGSRVVSSSWDPAARRLAVTADAPGCAYDILGLRLSRSFS
jgi:hypothetical protein